MFSVNCHTTESLAATSRLWQVPQSFFVETSYSEPLTPNCVTPRQAPVPGCHGSVTTQLAPLRVGSPSPRLQRQTFAEKSKPQHDVVRSKHVKTRKLKTSHFVWRRKTRDWPIPPFFSKKERTSLEDPLGVISST